MGPEDRRLNWEQRPISDRSPEGTGLGSLQNKRKKGREEDVAKVTLVKKNSMMKLLNDLLHFTIVKTLCIFVRYIDHNKHKTQRRGKLLGISLISEKH